VKNQSDLIVTVVAVLCMLIGVGVFFGTRKEAVKPQPPAAVVLSPLQMPAANVVMASSLPGASGGGAMGGGGGGRGGFGGGGRGGFSPPAGGGVSNLSQGGAKGGAPSPAGVSGAGG